MAAPYVAADTHGSMVVVVLACVSPVIASIFIALRFYSRRLQKTPYGSDDWVILAATFPLWAHTGIILWACFLGGVGHHIITLQLENVMELFKAITVMQFSFGISLGLIKTALVLLLMRIFTTPGFRKAAWFVLGYNACWTLMCILVGASMCRPFAKNWDRTLEGECGEQIPAYVSIAAFDIVGDMMIIALPMPKIWKLHQDTSTKIMLSFAFALGFFDVAVAILRIIYLVQLMQTDDYTWTVVNAGIWSALEPNIAVIIACGPTLRPLFRRLIGRKMRSTSNTYDSRAAHHKSKKADHSRSHAGLESLHSVSDDLIELRKPEAGKNTYTAETRSVVFQGTETAPTRGRPGKGIRVQSDIDVDYYAA